MAEIGVKVVVDANELDRLAIGGRLYDMLDMNNPSNKLHKFGDGSLMDDNKKIPRVIKEETVREMFELVNVRHIFLNRFTLIVEKENDKQIDKQMVDMIDKELGKKL